MTVFVSPAVFILLTGTFSTRLFVWLDERAGTVFFKLAKPGLMKAFEGKWTIRACDRTQPLSALIDQRGQRGGGAHQQEPQQLQLQQAPGLHNLSAQWTKGATSFANNIRGEPEGGGMLYASHCCSPRRSVFSTWVTNM